jgi:rod shape-determining protein MreD
MLIKGDMLNHLMSTTLDIDVVVIVIVYLLAYRSEIGAGIFALGLGMFMDIYSGGLWGFYGMLYLIIFLFIKIASRPFDLFSSFGQITVIFMGVLAKGISTVLLLHLFSLNSNFSSLNFLLLLISALVSGLTAPLIFFILNSLGRLFHRTFEES